MEVEEFSGENPLHIPVAELVVIEVQGYPLVEPKSNEVCLRYIQVYGAILLLIGMYAGFMTLIIWLFSPHTVGGKDDDR